MNETMIIEPKKL